MLLILSLRSRARRSRRRLTKTRCLLQSLIIDFFLTPPTTHALMHILRTRTGPSADIDTGALAGVAPTAITSPVLRRHTVPVPSFHQQIEHPYNTAVANSTGAVAITSPPPGTVPVVTPSMPPAGLAQTSAAEDDRSCHNTTATQQKEEEEKKGVHHTAQEAQFSNNNTDNWGTRGNSNARSLMDARPADSDGSGSSTAHGSASVVSGSSTTTNSNMAPSAQSNVAAYPGDRQQHWGSAGNNSGVPQGAMAGLGLSSFSAQHSGMESVSGTSNNTGAESEGEQHSGASSGQEGSGGGAFQCTEPSCQKQFASAFSLKRHVAAIHDRDRPFVCTYPGCEKTYVSASNLNTHMRVHTNDRPFQCPYEGCHKSFTAASTLSTHVLTHTGMYAACSSSRSLLWLPFPPCFVYGNLVVPNTVFRLLLRRGGCHAYLRKGHTM